MVKYVVLALGVTLISTNTGYCKKNKGGGGGTIIYYPQPYYPPTPAPVVVNPVVVNPVVVTQPSQNVTPVQATIVSSSPSGDSESGGFQVERFLKIRNDSGEKLTIFLQVRTRNDRGQFIWSPSQPGSQAKAMSFEVDAGQVLDLTGRVSASRVRLWAKSESSSFMDYANQDLWLVPETENNGEHRYRSSQMQTYTFTMKQQAPVGDR